MYLFTFIHYIFGRLKKPRLLLFILLPPFWLKKMVAAVGSRAVTMLERVHLRIFMKMASFDLSQLKYSLTLFNNHKQNNKQMSSLDIFKKLSSKSKQETLFKIVKH